MLHPDVLCYIFCFCGRNELLNFRLVSKGWKKIIEQVPSLISFIESDYFKAIVELSQKPIAIKYLGFDRIVMAYNYKYDISDCNILRIKVLAEPGLAVRAGVVFTFDEWKSTHWKEGLDKRNNEEPYVVPDPMEEMKKYNMYLSDKEEDWYYSDTYSGWIFDNGDVAIKIYNTKYCWFALYVDDKYGNRYWDNNNGWNYDFTNECRRTSWC